ncbi:hypothetical protein OF83DRAFT_1060180, partial [Amylostereum chailletii]
CFRVSATNNARISTLEHRVAEIHFSSHWPIIPTLTTVVWDAFLFYALLRDHNERGTCLSFDNKGDQVTRLDAALRARNMLMVGPARENWNHVCDKCCATKEVNGEFSVIRAAVMDGVTVGRPCCNVHDCQEELPSQRARFCSTHSSMSGLCVVIGCIEALASTRFNTCPRPTHHELEDVTGHSALFQHRRHLERLKMRTHEDDDQGVTEELLAVDADGETEDADGRVETSKESGCQKALEQLVVTPCGTMLARATFFGSEAMNGTRVSFLHVVYPTPRSVPQALFYDTACNFQKHTRRVNDRHFAVPVDTFHMKTKHKESDDFCGQYCDPDMFPDLLVDNRWRFNSSTAEMTNGYHAIAKEMRALRYDFFLDEMIKLRNRMIVEELHRVGANPLEVPREFIL